MPYIEREPVRNSIVGVYEQRQSFATEYVALDNTEYLAFIESFTPGPGLEARVDALAASVNSIIARLDRLEE